MGRERGVIADRVRLPLSDGDWIDVKRQLNAGEYRKLLTDQFKDAPEGDKVLLDHTKIGISKLLAYLLGWSLVSIVDHQPMPYAVHDPEELRKAALDDLDPDTYKEIIAAVNAHEAKEDAAREEKKRGAVTASTS